MNQICIECNNERSIHEFYKSTASKSGIERRCKKCRNEKTRKLRQEFKQWCVDYKGGQCIRCGYKKYRSALVFHHRDPSLKEFDFGHQNKGHLMTKEKAIKELDKCDLLCHNCHNEVHEELRSRSSVV